MAEKDIIEKTLEDYNDVFADIVNVLLFNGERRMQEDELQNIKARSMFKADGKLHEQERDVVKRWIRENVRLAFIGMENQTNIDEMMPIRVMSYDGIMYKSQLAEIEKCRRREKKPPVPVPVITLVIYFGAGQWEKTSLREIMDIPDYLDDYVSDYRINFFDIKKLTREQVDMFKSDFYILADYFYKVYHEKEYKPDERTIEHVDEVFKMMTVFTGDDRYEQAVMEIPDDSRRELRMCEVLDKIEARGIKIGETRGVEMGEQKLSRLIGCLRASDRNDDIDRVIADKDYREKLYEEFGI
ncbi:Rpn family recombination-promoting nuclease/putative transposase [Lachnospiraceae bacterium C1.1]|nr:Rpn family recombination-promoting nuclease/putative transposase [Lachnospiraceae bacterium C1.1]